MSGASPGRVELIHERLLGIALLRGDGLFRKKVHVARHVQPGVRELRFVLPSRIGHVETVRGISPDTALRCL